MEELKKIENELINLKSQANINGDTTLFAKIDSKLKELRLKISYLKIHKKNQESKKITREQQLDIANKKFFQRQRLLDYIYKFIQSNFEHFLQLYFINWYISLRNKENLDSRVQLEDRLKKAELESAKLRCDPSESISAADTIIEDKYKYLPKLTNSTNVINPQLNITEELKLIRLKQRLATFSEIL